MIEAKHRLNVLEHRIILLCLSQIRTNQPLSDNVKYKVRVKDVESLASLTPNQGYKNLKRAAMQLLSRRVSVSASPTGQDLGSEILVMGWVQSVSYRTDRGEIALRFNKDIIPYLTLFTREFTKYRLISIAKLTSSHAIRIYELLIQWRDKGSRIFQFKWLRSVLKLESSYSAAGTFKTWVIEPAIKQINLHTDISITHHSYQKTGRQISAVTIKFNVKGTRKPSAPPNLELFPDKWATYRKAAQNKDNRNIDEKLNVKS